jgi:hypothetical protein
MLLVKDLQRSPHYYITLNRLPEEKPFLTLWRQRCLSAFYEKIPHFLYRNQKFRLILNQAPPNKKIILAADQLCIAFPSATHGELRHYGHYILFYFHFYHLYFRIPVASLQKNLHCAEGLMADDQLWYCTAC